MISSFSWGQGGPALLGLLVIDHSLLFLVLSLQSPIVSFPLYKPSLSFPLSASDDDSQSGYRKFRQNCCFLRTCTVTSIMRINTVLIVNNHFFSSIPVKIFLIFLNFFWYIKLLSWEKHYLLSHILHSWLVLVNRCRFWKEMRNLDDFISEFMEKIRARRNWHLYFECRLKLNYLTPKAEICHK